MADSASPRGQDVNGATWTVDLLGHGSNALAPGAISDTLQTFADGLAALSKVASAGRQGVRT